VKKKNSLTAAQQQMLVGVRDEWIRVGLSTEPADFELAERALVGIYREGGLPPPRYVVRLASPLAGAIGQAYALRMVRAQVNAQVDDQVAAQVDAQVAAQVRAQVNAQVDAQVADQVADQVHDQVRAQVNAQVAAQVDAQVNAQVHDQVYDQVDAQVAAQVDDQVADQVAAQVHDQVYDQVAEWRGGWNGGNLWAGWCSYYDAMGKLGVKACVRLEPTRALSRSCGWWWSFRDFAILTDRPRVLRRDDRGRLHSETSPALLYRDGWALHVWHGIRVPRDWIEDRANLDPATALTWPNIEQRRAAAEIVGWAKVLDALPHRVIDRDEDPEIGTLLEVDLPDAPGEQFLRVRCPTGRDFALCVSGENFSTALEAQAAMAQIPATLFRQSKGART
jgi:hypothetical protein